MKLKGKMKDGILGKWESHRSLSYKCILNTSFHKMSIRVKKLNLPSDFLGHFLR